MFILVRVVRMGVFFWYLFFKCSLYIQYLSFVSYHQSLFVLSNDLVFNKI